MSEIRQTDSKYAFKKTRVSQKSGGQEGWGVEEERPGIQPQKRAEV